MNNKKRTIGEKWYDGCSYCIMTIDGLKRYDSMDELELENGDTEEYK
jgi:hypothetical protein